IRDFGGENLSLLCSCACRANFVREFVTRIIELFGGIGRRGGSADVFLAPGYVSVGASPELLYEYRGICPSRRTFRLGQSCRGGEHGRGGEIFNYECCSHRALSPLCQRLPPSPAPLPLRFSQPHLLKFR